jgi:hypothetical protein
MEVKMCHQYNDYLNVFLLNSSLRTIFTIGEEADCRDADEEEE